MATTTNYSFTKPTVGGDTDAWGGFLNVNWDALDALLSGTGSVDGVDIINATGQFDDLTAGALNLSFLTGTRSRPVVVNASGDAGVLGERYWYYEEVSVPAGAAYTFATAVFPIADGETMELRAITHAVRTDGGAVGAHRAEWAAMVHRSGSDYTTYKTTDGGNTMNGYNVESIGTGSTLDMKCVGSAGDVYPSYKQQSGETWTWRTYWIISVFS